jgi:hypothetical protein
MEEEIFGCLGRSKCSKLVKGLDGAQKETRGLGNPYSNLFQKGPHDVEKPVCP